MSFLSQKSTQHFPVLWTLCVLLTKVTVSWPQTQVFWCVECANEVGGKQGNHFLGWSVAPKYTSLCILLLPPSISSRTWCHLSGFGILCVGLALLSLSSMYNLHTGRNCDLWGSLSHSLSLCNLRHYLAYWKSQYQWHWDHDTDVKEVPP